MFGRVSPRVNSIVGQHRLTALGNAIINRDASGPKLVRTGIDNAGSVRNKAVAIMDDQATCRGSLKCRDLLGQIA
eukprot:scaffold53436_cov28-Prasinocladus_malaysianus.AAC.4